MRPRTSPTLDRQPPRCGPALSFEDTCDLIARMHDNHVRQHVGALEIVSGLVDGDDVTECATLVIDPATGASYVSQWVAA